MGVDLATFRLRIGGFSSVLLRINARLVCKCKRTFMKTVCPTDRLGKVVILSLILVLLLRGGVEQNPGPGDTSVKPKTKSKPTDHTQPLLKSRPLPHCAFKSDQNPNQEAKAEAQTQQCANQEAKRRSATVMLPPAEKEDANGCQSKDEPMGNNLMLRSPQSKRGDVCQPEENCDGDLTVSQQVNKESAGAGSESQCEKDAHRTYFPCKNELENVRKMLEEQPENLEQLFLPNKAPASDDTETDNSVRSGKGDKQGFEHHKPEPEAQRKTAEKDHTFGFGLRGHVKVDANSDNHTEGSTKLLRVLEKRKPDLKKEELDAIERLVHPHLLSQEEISPFLLSLDYLTPCTGNRMKPFYHLKLTNANEIKESRDLEVNKRRLDRYKKTDLSNFRFGFLPVRIFSNPGHWILEVADFIQNRVSLLDSSTKCPVPKEKWIDIWRCLGVGDPVNWKIGNLESGKQDGETVPEEDKVSCGAFVMLNAFLIVIGEDPSDYTLDDAKLCRMYALVRRITEKHKIRIPGLDLSCSEKRCKRQSLVQVPCQGDCREWFHNKCAEFDAKFVCLDCRKKKASQQPDRDVDNKNQTLVSIPRLDVKTFSHYLTKCKKD